MDRDLERRLIYKLQDCYAGLPRGLFCEWEAPDFLLRTDAGILGLELTQVFRPTPDRQLPRQALERYEAEIVELAQERYEAAGGPPLDVAVLFSPWARPSRKRREELAETIAQLLLAAPLVDGTALWLEVDETNYQAFPPEVDYIRAFRYGDATIASWTVHDVDWDEPCTAELLRARVAEKEARLSAYLGKCDRAWLVIAVNVSGLSTMLQVDGAALLHTCPSAFERVLLFDSLSRQVWEVGAPMQATT